MASTKSLSFKSRQSAILRYHVYHLQHFLRGMHFCQLFIFTVRHKQIFITNLISVCQIHKRNQPLKPQAVPRLRMNGIAFRLLPNLVSQWIRFFFSLYNSNRLVFHKKQIVALRIPLHQRLFHSRRAIRNIFLSGNNIPSGINKLFIYFDACFFFWQHDNDSYIIVQTKPLIIVIS